MAATKPPTKSKASPAPSALKSGVNRQRIQGIHEPEEGEPGDKDISQKHTLREPKDDHSLSDDKTGVSRTNVSRTSQVGVG